MITQFTTLSLSDYKTKPNPSFQTPNFIFQYYDQEFNINARKWLEIWQ